MTRIAGNLRADIVLNPSNETPPGRPGAGTDGAL
eukprot:CAMPEP_0181460306 /NCGR_PEP_ID=MMETSP1110-20121109/33271_1 /TAXON_ID=174948 /ORGANISM="Symbiodinium sp., Strain CCMP421" /LENGTH=33 /DNA_ID= /DNA_START= /DNA_END= /DNA_ORIENTATION=